MSDLTMIERICEIAGIGVRRSKWTEPETGAELPALLIAGKNPWGYNDGKVEMYFDAGHRLVGIDGWR